MGFEPTTSAVTGRRSNQLSHRAILKVYTFKTAHQISSINSSLFLFLATNQRLIVYLPASFGQALDRLVPASSIHYCTSTSGLSTSSSSRGLTSLWNGISHLKGGFTLRCLQRLSLPDLAALPWLRQQVHQRSVHPGPLVLRTAPLILRPHRRPRRIGTELSHDVLNPARVPL